MGRYTTYLLAKELHKFTGVPYRQAMALISIILERIKASIVKGQVVEFHNFGIFEFSKNRIKFRPAKGFRKLVRKEKDGREI